MFCFSSLSGSTGTVTGGILAGICAIFLGTALILSLVLHIFSSLGYCAIAKRRGIRKAWLAWIPVGQLWILGSISDQYQLQAHYRTKSRRKVLLCLQVILLILMACLLISAAVTVLSAFKVVNAGNPDPFIDIWRPVRENLMSMVWLYFVLFGVALGNAVAQYVALYDLYRSCDPDNSVLFLVLSILISAVMPFLVFASRNKDLGMQPSQTHRT